MCVPMCVHNTLSYYIHPFLLRSIHAVLYFASFPEQYIPRANLCPDWDLLRARIPQNLLCSAELHTMADTCQTLNKCWMNRIPNRKWLKMGHTSFSSFLHLCFFLQSRRLREVCRATWCLAREGPPTNVRWRNQSGTKIMTRQSLSDKLLINDNWATGIPCQEVNERQVPSVGRCSHTLRNTAKAYAYCACPNAWVGFGLGGFVCFVLFCFFKFW